MKVKGGLFVGLMMEGTTGPKMHRIQDVSFYPWTRIKPRKTAPCLRAHSAGLLVCCRRDLRSLETWQMNMNIA